MRRQMPNGLLAWFTRKKIEDGLVNVTLEQQLIDGKDKRKLCHRCKDYTADVCCRSYPCDNKLNERLEELGNPPIMDYRPCIGE